MSIHSLLDIMAYGDDPVFFRSPLLDLNGIGFEADLGKRTVLVKSDVNIVLRMETSDPRRFKPDAKLPEKYDFVRATSDSMRIDMVEGSSDFLVNDEQAREIYLGPQFSM